jgi:capsular polysaccharide transport system ATP-binding protein
MRARLAFGLSLAIEFDCYLIDEVIMVGDRNFQVKCHAEIFEKRNDRALLLATHGENYIREYCNLAVVLRNGKAEVYDDIEEALAIYDTL